jgi:D-aminoacyl-tRNA deacylase
MIAVIQRISNGTVTVDGECVAECGIGLYVLVGVTHTDTEEDVNLLADKIAKMRVFCDENGKMNLSAADVGGGFMVVPNFTLYGSYRRGNRPDYMNSASPDVAKPLFDKFVARLAEHSDKVSSGIFGAHMIISTTLDGPITIPMYSDVLKQPKK